MDDRESGSNPPLFSLFDNPFHCLGLDLFATDQEVEEAFNQAQSLQTTSIEFLVYARASLLDPATRLPAELSYLIDSTPDEIASINAILAEPTPLDTIVEFGNGLRPISRANFLTHVAGLTPADSNTLCAILGAHALLNSDLVYATLKTIRTKALLLPPSLLSVNQTLDHLIYVHSQSILKRYDKVEDAALALSMCIDRIRTSDDARQKRALERMLHVYRLTFGSRQADGLAKILNACKCLLIQPTNRQLDELLYLLRSWILTSLPLISNGRHRTAEWHNFEIIRQRLSAVLGNLTVDHHYQIALKLASFAQTILDPVFSNRIPFADDVRLIENFLSHRADRVADDIDHAKETDLQPTELLLQGKFPSTESQRHSEHGVPTDPPAPPLTFSPPRNSGRTLQRPPVIALAAVSLCLLLSGAFYLAQVGHLVPNWVRVAYLPARIAEVSAPINDTETVPPVGTGQHLDLEGVRYCHYQEERLKLVQPDVRGPDAVRSFNLLAVDYNARCSDYFYKDNDVAAVKAEIIANHQRLADDAKRIISSWSGVSVDESGAAARP